MRQTIICGRILLRTRSLPARCPRIRIRFAKELFPMAAGPRMPYTLPQPGLIHAPSEYQTTLGRSEIWDGMSSEGPSVYNADLYLFKSFPIGEGMKLQLRGEAFNVFNIQNLDAPSAVTINSSGSSIAAGAGRITALAQGTTPRQLQFGIRFVF